MSLDLETRVTMALNRAFDEHLISQGGLGEEVDEGGDPLSDLAQKPEFKAASEKIRPWIWVFSIFGFGMALINTHRIKKIFKSWKGARHYAKSKD